MALCWPLQMPPTPKAVLISLADNANDHGECWPSLTRIAERTCFGRTAVIEAIHWLEQNKYLTADRGNGRHSRYAIDLNTLKQGDLLNVKPVRHADRSVRRTSPAGVSDPSASRTGPVRQADTNHKEPSRTVTKSITPKTVDLDFSSWPSAPSAQVLADWLAHRKAKKAPVSQTVLSAFGRELHKAAAMGIDVDTCLSTAMQRNWQGLNASWLEQKSTGATNVRPRPAPETFAARITRKYLEEERDSGPDSAERSGNALLVDEDVRLLCGEVVKQIR